MKFTVIKKENALRPVTPSDWEIFNQYPEGHRDVIKLKKKRTPAQIKLFDKWWAVMRLLYQNQREVGGKQKWGSPERVSKSLLIACGYYRKYYGFKGTVYIEAESIAFENCDPEKFEEIWERAVPFILKELGCTENELNENLVFYL